MRRTAAPVVASWPITAQKTVGGVVTVGCRHSELRCSSEYGNVTYTVLDAVTEPFPSDRYDVIVWDGGLGHVTPDAAHGVLAKIKVALAPDGIFVGSESLGHEGHDHLQFFSSVGDLCALFEPHFANVLVRSLDYELPGLTRQEAFWRCGSSRVRMDEASWTSCAAQSMP